jgi:hypothetical protein
MAIDRGALNLTRNAGPLDVANNDFEPIREQQVMLHRWSVHQTSIKVRLDFAENHVVNGVE